MHKPFSASNISNSLSTKRKTRKQSKEKPSKTPNLPLNITKGDRTHHEGVTQGKYFKCYRG